MPRATRPADLNHITPELRRFAVPIASISRDPANLRLHPERSIRAVAASLRRFGQQKPIVLDAAGCVIAGNGMHEAAESLGWTHVAAIKCELAGVDRVAYGIADNRTAELSKWDAPSLAATLKELPQAMLEDAGYTLDEVRTLQDLGAEAGDEGAPPPSATAIARPGELWRLGRHRLLCGDSTKADDVARVMGGAKAQLVATDPPYLVNYTGERLGDNGKDWSGIYNEIAIDDAEGFFRALFTNVLAAMADHAAIYCWHAHLRCGLIQRVWEELGILDHQQLIWVKPTSVFSSCMYHFQHEPCMMGWRKGSKPRHDGRNELTSVWALKGDVRTSVELKEHADVWAADWQGKSRPIGNEHPTEKPVEIFARPMRRHTQAGDVCFEPFSGSGSQLVAAEQLGRELRAIEISPVFVDVGIRRWQKLTGQAATLEGDGRTWDQIAAERGCSHVGDMATSPADPDKPVASRRGRARAAAAVPAAATAEPRRRRRRAGDAVGPAGAAAAGDA